MDPAAINAALSHDVKRPVDISADFDRWSSYARPVDFQLEAYAPICIRAPQVSNRIRAQSGLFTLHGSNLYPLDYYTVTRPLLTKILIPDAAAKSMRAELFHLGITPSFVFPDSDGVAKEVREIEEVH